MKWKNNDTYEINNDSSITEPFDRSMKIGFSIWW